MATGTEGYQIAAVARLTGLSTDTIRVWERRYGLVTPQRDAAGIRRYADVDIARLQRARRATEAGHPIRIVAAMSDEQITTLLERDAVPGVAQHDPITGSIVTAVLGAIREGDAPRARRTVRNASLLLEPRDVVLDVFVPLMEELGRLWEGGEIAVWQEHLLSDIVSSATGTIGRTTNEPAERGFIFATPPGELHALGIAFAAMLAAGRGRSSNNLGPNVPASELVAAVRRLRAQCVVIGTARSATTAAAMAPFVEELERDLPSGVALWIGGPADAHVATTSRARCIPTLAEFADLVHSGR